VLKDSNCSDMDRDRKHDDPRRFERPTEPILPTDEEDTEALVSSPWTRSPGRVRFRSLLQQSLDRGSQRPNYLFAILCVDLDRFTRVKDSFGRQAADDLLMEVARRFRSCLRPQDIIIRLHEDEYLIFLDEIQQVTKALEVIDRMKAALRTAFDVGGQEVLVSASVGVAMGPHGYSKAHEIVRDAEAAMHRSKAKGRGSYEVFDSRIHEESKKLLKLETEFRGAIDHNQLRLQYEPIVALATGQVSGFEALVRWMHPDRGLVHPGEFIAMAEHTELIIPMTQWVMHEACHRLKRWQDRYPRFASTWLSINLSPMYIEKCDFAQELSAQVAASGLDASNLILEITESQLLENADYILKGFTTLQDTGIKLWIDDFGAGYSSLAYLVKFPIHSLKIDRSFISKLVHDDKSTAIANAIVSLGKTLGVNVIAEGVETQEQFDYLRSYGCPYAQGYYFSPSADPETIEALFDKQQG
jgi:diguanylate cyclase (GGDEF)-like protein